MFARRKTAIENFDMMAAQTDSDAEFFRLNDELTCASEALLAMRTENEELRSALERARAVLAKLDEHRSVADIDSVLSDDKTPAFAIPAAVSTSHHH